MPEPSGTNPPDYPPAGFSFSVNLDGAASTSTDSRFKEASGLAVEMAVEEIPEGGENRFRHRAPSGSKYNNLVLKRGLVTASQPFFLWCQQTIQNNLASPIVPKTVEVFLLDPKGNPLKKWNLVNAWPVKWSVSDFNSQESAVVIESLELSYQYFEIK
jgi:phage tail-like protein